MLNKVKWGGLIAGIIMLVRMFLPDIAMPEGFQNAIMLIVVFVSQFFIKETPATVSRLKFKKTAKFGVPVICLIFFLLNTAPTSAQQLEFKDTLAVGGGSLFGEEVQTFSTNTLFGAVHWQGLKLPLNISTGIGVEFSVKPALEGGNELVYTIWNLIRAKISERFYAGTDAKLLEEGAGNFDQRIVTGMILGKIRDHELALEVYSLEENRPISFAIFYRF